MLWVTVVRYLHNINCSGWWFGPALPFIFIVLYIKQFIMPKSPMKCLFPNKYGEAPYEYWKSFYAVYNQEKFKENGIK